MVSHLKSNNYLTKFLIETEINKFRHENDALPKSVEQSNLFLSKMSHNIRTPLNVVLNLIDILKENTISISPDCEFIRGRCSYIDDTILKNISTLSVSANNLFLTVNEILDYEKIISGQIQVKKEEFAIIDIVNELHEIYSSVIEKKV